MKRKHKCEKCGKKFASKKNLATHARTHQKKIVLKKNVSCYLLVILIALIVIFITLKTEKPDENPYSPDEGIINIHSPLNETYSQEKIILNVSFDEPAQVAYNSIDGGGGIPECGYCWGYTRYDLKFGEGTHKILFTVETLNNTTVTKEVVFSVKMPSN